MISSTEQMTLRRATLDSMIEDIVQEKMLQLEPGERLWKLFCFQPLSGRETHLEHRIYSKCKIDGNLALVTFAVHTPRPSVRARSALARVGELTPITLMHIIETIRSRTQTTPEEYFEVDLSDIATLGEQLAVLDAKPSAPEGER